MVTPTSGCSVLSDIRDCSSSIATISLTNHTAKLANSSGRLAAIHQA